MSERTAIVKTFYTVPQRPKFFFENQVITCVKIEVLSENKLVDVDVFYGGVFEKRIDFVVTGYETKILNSKATVYGIQTKLT